MRPKKIYIVRHGQTDFNKSGVLQGRGVNSSLNKKGVDQAKAFHSAFGSYPFEKLYTSKLKRTQESVQGFIDAGLNWERFEGLDEISWGSADGTKISEIEGYHDILEAWIAGDTTMRAKNGETPEEVALRQMPVIEKMKKEPVDNLLVCMHGRAMRILMCTLTSRPISEMNTFPHHNLGLYVVDFDGVDFKLSEVNLTDHLRVKEGLLDV